MNINDGRRFQVAIGSRENEGGRCIRVSRVQGWPRHLRACLQGEEEGRVSGSCEHSTRFILVPSSNDTRDYALKQIEGAGLSTSACREISVGAIRFALIDYVEYRF